MLHPLARSLAGAVSAALLAVLAACAADAPTSTDASVRVERVVLVTIDGLRADAIDSMPTIDALRRVAVWTDDARSVLPAITLPAHLSLLTGRDVTALGIRDNEFGEPEALAMVVSGTTPVFQWIDGPSDAVIGASLLPAIDLEQARDFFGLRRLTATSLDDAAIIDAAIEGATAPDAPALMFVHLPAVDLAGHAHGWIEAGGGGAEPTLTASYVAAARAADQAIALLHDALAPAIAAGKTALVITADHGGGHGLACAVDMPPEREHCSAHAGDQSVPLFIVARDAAPRRLAGVTPIVHVGPTVARLLGAPIPPWAAAALIP